jgi:hypothetical protein
MFAACNNAHQGFADVEYVSDIGVRYSESAHAADQENVVIGQFGLKRRRAHAAKPLSVPRVFAERAPFKVCDDIIGFVRVNVVNDRKVVGIRNECDRHESVDVERGTLPVLGQNHSWISLDLDQHYSANPALRMSIGVNDCATDTSDAAEITDLVLPFVTNDGSPFLSDADIHSTGCPSGEIGLAVKDPSNASTSAGPSIMDEASSTYNRRLRFL